MTHPTEIHGTRHMGEVIHVPMPAIRAVLIILSIPAGLLMEQMEINANEDVKMWSQSQQSALISRKQALEIERLERLVENGLCEKTINAQAAIQTIFQN